MLPNITSQAEELKYTIAIDAIKAENNIQSLAKLIVDIAKELNISFKSVQAALEEAFTTESVAEISGEIETRLDPAIKKTIASATALAKAIDKAKGAATELSATKIDLSSPKMASSLAFTDSTMQGQVNATLNALALKELAQRKIQQDLVNKADAEAIALTQKLTTSLAERAIQENNVAVANKKIVAANLAEADAKMLALQERMVTVMAERAITANNVALANQRIAQSESANKMLFAPRDIEAPKKLANNLKEVPPAAERAGHGILSFANFVRTAFGTLVAIGLFNVITTITEFFKNSYQAAVDYRAKMAELNFAEAVLSKKGMDITRAELDTFISDIAEKFKYLTTLEVTGIVSTVSSMGAEFKLTKENIVGLSEAIAFLQLKERAYGMEVSKSGSIINAALDGRSNYFNALGINITKTAIKEKVYAMGLAEVGTAITKEMSNQAAIALLIEQTSGKYDELIASIERVNPALADQLRVSKALSESQKRVGEAVLVVKDSWNDFLSTLIESGGLESLTDSLIATIEGVDDLISAIGEATTVVSNFMKGMEALSGGEKKEGGLLGKFLFGGLFSDFLQSLVQGLATILAMIGAWVATMWIEISAGVPVLKAWEDAGARAREAWKSGWAKAGRILRGEEELFTQKNKEDIPLPPDTPPSPQSGEEIVDDSKLKDALEKMNNEILEAQLKLAQDMEEAAIDLGRKLVDITTEYAKKRADAERDYANKVADINSSYRSRIASINASQAQANQQARNQELEREAKFQNQMQELKEKFLMDLEDALHARDARQILRLIKQYNLEKTQAEREHALEQENSARDNAARNKKFAQERADAERERREKLAEAQRDYADKLAKLAADEQAERDAAELAYQRKKEDLEREMQDRLEIVAANLVAEFNLTKEGLDAILALYQRYYSEVAAIYQAMNAMMMGQQNLQGATITSKGGGGSGGGNKGIMKAEGGMVIADRPTTVTFGENNEPEMGFFAPLGRTGRDVNKVFSNMSGSGAGGVEGTIGLDVFLSPDLEARIVKNALGQTAQIVTKIRRSK